MRWSILAWRRWRGELALVPPPAEPRRSWADANGYHLVRCWPDAAQQVAWINAKYPEMMR